MLTSENHFKTDFQSKLYLIDSSLTSLAILTSDNYGQKAYFFQLRKYVDIRVQLLKENLNIKSDSKSNAQSLRQGIIAMEHCKDYMGKMRHTGQALLDSIVATKNKYQQLNLNFFIAIFITACLICIIAIGVFLENRSWQIAFQE